MSRPILFKKADNTPFARLIYLEVGGKNPAAEIFESADLLRAGRSNEFDLANNLFNLLP